MSNTFLGFSHLRNPSWLTKLIMKIDKSSVSHSFMVYYDEDWKLEMVIQIDEFGYRLIPFERYKKGNEVKFLFDMSNPKYGNFEEGMIRLSREFAGTKYDFKGFIGMGLVLFWRAFKRRIKNPWASKGTLICSEGAALALQYGGCPGSDKLIPDSTSPQDLLDFLNGV